MTSIVFHAGEPPTCASYLARSLLRISVSTNCRLRVAIQQLLPPVCSKCNSWIQAVVANDARGVRSINLSPSHSVLSLYLSFTSSTIPHILHLVVSFRGIRSASFGLNNLTSRPRRSSQRTSQRTPPFIRCIDNVSDLEGRSMRTETMSISYTNSSSGLC